MAIVGIRRVTYGVHDFAASTRFYRDFGLVADGDDESRCDFTLPDLSVVSLRKADDPELPAAFEAGPGVRQLTWAVDTMQALETFEKSLSTDREVKRISGQAISFVDDAGLPTVLELFTPRPVTSPADPLNAPGRIERWNQNRRWYAEARPKVMQHIVFAHPDVRRTAAFYVNRLGFRISDIQDGGGFFLRADGRNEHHNIFWQPGKSLSFRHIAFGVESIDEIMAGAANMNRNGWHSALGLGRHRISSTFFYYIPNPAGGDAEYSSDTDYLDDTWVPRVWGRKFGHIWWVSRPRDEAPAEEVRLTRPEERVL
ncbi:VOC family protein [Pigmentiphaga sp. GD03639]|uniref:VOC family protein n=1 Tax=Pigmentiphaga sp. GD03639 TaxID=2975354 RepID=UPI002447096C|nr:VOC family protein [Pigmentiphaga sp. GD03639]MDH2234707.1 VOC family protein [Pigmentiphaga sp. GD03639]